MSCAQRTGFRCGQSTGDKCNTDQSEARHPSYPGSPKIHVTRHGLGRTRAPRTAAIKGSSVVITAPFPHKNVIGISRFGFRARPLPAARQRGREPTGESDACRSSGAGV
jgi:hypothetical protein